jgi:hypothetical protein
MEWRRVNMTSRGLHLKKGSGMCPPYTFTLLNLSSETTTLSRTYTEHRLMKSTNTTGFQIEDIGLINIEGNKIYA